MYVPKWLTRIYKRHGIITTIHIPVGSVLDGIDSYKATDSRGEGASTKVDVARFFIQILTCIAEGVSVTGNFALPNFAEGGIEIVAHKGM